MWHLSIPWYELVFRASFIYIALLFMFRIWGKKHLGQLAAFDLLVLLIMSEAVQNSLVADDHSVQGGLIVVTTFMLLSYGMSYLSFKSRRAERFLEGTPKVLIRKGKIMDEVMQKEQISLADLLESMREQGVSHLADIDLAMLEANGKISVVKK